MRIHLAEYLVAFSFIHPFMHACRQTSCQAYIHACICTYARKDTHSHAHTYMYHTHLQQLTHAVCIWCIHSHTHAHTQYSCAATRPCSQYTTHSKNAYTPPPLPTSASTHTPTLAAMEAAAASAGTHFQNSARYWIQHINNYRADVCE